MNIYLTKDIANKYNITSIIYKKVNGKKIWCCIVSIHEKRGSNVVKFKCKKLKR